MNHIIKNLPEEQRPYEKCFKQGENTLSDSELLAVILRSGTQGKNSLALAQEILHFMEDSAAGSDEDSWDRTGKSGTAEMYRRTFQTDCQNSRQAAAGNE